ncbi:hypothetical protein ACFRR7_07435 [Streptomyces sp. NPDC056909]|uniref:hypothetical protein n=1 Tax=Streptomyces sp. NPDC056909 TaxID=3345963 RepID=UPI00367ABC4E
MIARLRQPPLRVKGHSTQDSRMVGVRILLSWLETFPGDTWQQRWEASPIAAEPEKWYEKVREWTPTVDRATRTGHLQAGCWPCSARTWSARTQHGSP